MKAGSFALLMPTHDAVLSALAEDYAGEQHAPPQPREGVTRSVLWKNVDAEMPDDETSVLVYTPADAEPVWIGFHADGKWRCPGGIPLSFAVTHWAHLPEPPPLL